MLSTALRPSIQFILVYLFGSDGTCTGDLSGTTRALTDVVDVPQFAARRFPPLLQF